MTRTSRLEASLGGRMGPCSNDGVVMAPMMPAAPDRGQPRDAESATPPGERQSRGVRGVLNNWPRSWPIVQRRANESQTSDEDAAGRNPAEGRGSQGRSKSDSGGPLRPPSHKRRAGDVAEPPARRAPPRDDQGTPCPAR